MLHLSSPQTHLLFVGVLSAVSAVKVLAIDTEVLSVGNILATALGLESVASPDPEVRSSGRVHGVFQLDFR